MSPLYNLPVMIKDPDMTQELFDFWKDDFETLERNLTKDSILTGNYIDMLDLQSVANLMIVSNMAGSYEVQAHFLSPDHSYVVLQSS